MKTDADYFVDWEAHVFGSGYGTGEEHVFKALLVFFQSLEDRRSYDHRVLESRLQPMAAWLLINTLCHADIIEYGTSPRFGWLTAKGEKLRDFLDGKNLEYMEAVWGQQDPEYTHCYPDHCNCDGPKCSNPFWRNR